MTESRFAYTILNIHTQSVVQLTIVQLTIIDHDKV